MEKKIDKKVIELVKAIKHGHLKKIKILSTDLDINKVNWFGSSLLP